MSMAQPPNYQFMVAEKWQNNLENVAVKLNRGDSDLLQQIQKFANRFGYDQTQVENMIHREPMFAACFAKSPSHQRIHEKIAVEWLESELDIQIKILPVSGCEAKYVLKNGVIASIEAGDDRPSKSLDFCWEFNGTTFFAMHNYFDENGGAHGRTKKDIEEVLVNFKPASNRTKILIVIVDGKFFSPKRLGELQELTRPSAPQSYIVRIEEVANIMAKY